MPANDFLAYATGGGANVTDQATYAGAGYVTTGRTDGILPSAVYNKIARQGNYGTAALGKIINDLTGLDALDDGNLTSFVANLKTALLANSFSTGRIRAMLDTVAAAGFVPLNDGTIGDGASGASTRANADCHSLFVMIWNNVADAAAPVTGGRGSSAEADWAAHKKIQLGTFLGRALASAGTGSGLTARALGSTFGEENHVLLTGEIPTHTHASPAAGQFLTSGAAGGSGSATGTNFTPSGVTGNNAGGGGSHNTMQPSTFVNMEIKL